MKTLKAKDLFNATKFIIWKISISMAYGVRIDAALRGKVRPSSLTDPYYQAMNRELFVSVGNIKESVVDALCMEHQGMSLMEMPQLK